MRPSADAVVIGGGPAGMTAALYLARFRRHVRVFDAGVPRARLIPRSHNMPGFPSGVSGAVLLQRMRRQLARHGVTVESADVTGIVRSGDGFRIHADTLQADARAVVVATGIVDRLPEINDVHAAIAAQVVRLCAVCDGYEAAQCRVGVFGPPRSGARHALYMRGLARNVTLLLSEPESGADVLPRDELARAGVAVVEVVPGLQYDGTAVTAETSSGRLRFDAFYPVLGCTPRAALATALGAACDARGELIVDAHQCTTVAGMYAIGDVVHALNQVSVAVGHAAIAASALHSDLPRAWFQG